MKLNKILIALFLILAISLTVGSINAAMRIAINDGEPLRYHVGEEHRRNMDYESNCYNGFDQNCKFYGYSDVRVGIHGSSRELKSIKFVNIKINGKNWKNLRVVEGYDQYAEPYRSTFVKGNVKGKYITVTAYNYRNKPVLRRTKQIKSIQTELSYM
ncbi:MAG: hypothetical protein FWH29_04310 [Methanobrevibacter sp.]|nr:hypothetical protein [Methanobrevibacter sp.]